METLTPEGVSYRLYCLIRILSRLSPFAKSCVSVMISHVTRLFRPSLAIPFLISVLSFPGATAPRAQTSPSSTQSIVPGTKPPDAPAEWKRHVGIYEYSSYRPPKVIEIFLERDQRLYMRDSSGKEVEISILDGRLAIPPPESPKWTYHFADDDGTPAFIYLNEAYTRKDAGADPSHFYHVKALQPVTELRKKALKLSPPAEAGRFRKPDFVELVSLDPTIHLDVRYASERNFLSTPVYTQARAFMQRPAAEALVRVLHKLQPLGYGLLIHDAYRPWYVTKIFWDATPPEGKIFVANPQEGSKHNRGCAVDLTLYDLATGQAVEMPGLYDEMSPRSFPNFPGGTSLQRWHRDLLRRAMESEGFTVNEDEWWHFDYKDWKEYGILNVPFEKMGVGQQPATVSH
jgi:zinc D-Ala-D-Ala dipeptidase